MTLFDERERAFELMFAHDEEMRFLALARRNKLLGRWAAERMGLSGAQADRYAQEVVDAVLNPACDEHIMAKIRADFAARGLEQPDGEIGQAAAASWTTAVAQIRAEARDVA